MTARASKASRASLALGLGVVLAVALGVVGGCSDDAGGGRDRAGTTRVERTTSSTSTSLVAGGASTSSPGGADPVTPTGLDGGPTSVPGAGAPSSTAAVPPPTAAPTDPMPAGRSFGFVTGVNVADRIVTVDVAELLTGDAAVAAAIADGAVPPDAIGVDNDYYVRNRNPLVRTVAVAPAAVVRTLQDLGSPRMHETSLAQLAVHVSLRRSFGQSGAPAWVTVTGGVVTRIEEVYFP